MEIRSYDPERDPDVIKEWITDERTHAMWCAGRIPYPLSREGLERFILEEEAMYGNIARVAVSGEGEPVGFYCFSIDSGTAAGRLKFVVTSPELRGKGYGRDLVLSAVRNAFRETDVSSVGLCVFSCNGPALKCYRNAGFVQRSCDAGAFRFRDEVWDRIYMTIEKDNSF